MLDDATWFSLRSDRQLRLRPAMPEEALPARPGAQSLKIVGRSGAARTFQVGPEFACMDRDIEISMLLSRLTQRMVALDR
jgi:hypothetical protein